MADVSNEQIEVTKELERIADDLQGVRDVQSIYGELASSQYKILLIADRDSLELAKDQIDVLLQNLKPNENGERQFVLMVNNSNPNPAFYMDEETKNSTIDAFKGVIPLLDDNLESAYEAKKAELDALG